MADISSKTDGTYWRAENGTVRCLYDDCPAICSMDCPIYLQTLALESFQRNELQNAIQLLTQAVQKEPSFGDAWNNLAMCYGTIGDDQKALDYYKKAYDLRKKPTTLFGLVVASRSLKQYTAAMQYAKEYVDQYGMNEQIASQMLKIMNAVKGEGKNGFVQ
ncbi:MAG: tetratricopeptide repeat protein [Clostridiales bacterium]|nr:tetratricopeptide repeat protein [Clostridiales bacterium]